MILLTKNNAKERCRTCLCKLLKSEEISSDVENVAEICVQSKFADMNVNKELQEMLETYLPIHWKVDFYKDKLYPQFLCLDCVKHLQSFETFRNKAMESAKKLYRVLSDSSNVPKIELSDEGLQCKVDSKDDIFNLFLKDSLMETEAIILDEADTNTAFHSTDPDPFQNTQKQNNITKPRGKRAKRIRNCVLKAKTNIRISKKLNRINENGLIKNKSESTLLTKNRADKTKNEDGNENFGCQDIPYQDDDSSDNEVLSNKITHSISKAKNTKGDQGNFHLNHGNYEYKPELLNSGSQNKEDIEKTIKTELDFSIEDSSNSDINTNEDAFPKTLKIEKKKRHYILNSGRKKGLANRYKCDQCQHKFGHKLTLEAHVRKIHEGEKKAFKCELCDKAYSFIGGLSTHIRDVHERKQDSYDCSVPGCDKKYSNFITLQRHVRFKHMNMEASHQYVCEQCGATFKQSSNLRYHMKTRHPTEEDLKRKELLPKDRLECEECKKSFHSQYTLKYHKLRVHADEKKFECKICGRRVAKQFMLDSHMLVHSDQKMACKFCGREFVRKYQVEAHIRAVHQKLKPFQCPHCSESFASRKTLRHHIYIHTGEKPYVCDICGQAYRQPTCLKNHRKIHNKLSATTTLAVNRSFISNFVQSSDTLANGEKILK